MKKSMLYTRTGDRGTTALVGGSRVAKNSPRVNAYGCVDELNAHLGVVRAMAVNNPQATTDASVLTQAMCTMFSIGAYLATPEDSAYLNPDGITDADIEALERAIDRLDSEVPAQRSFILPGGTLEAARTHLARTVCRRAEREVLTFADTGATVDERVMRYLNRLSDYLYILARAFNHWQGVADVPWPTDPSQSS